MDGLDELRDRNHNKQKECDSEQGPDTRQRLKDAASQSCLCAWVSGQETQLCHRLCSLGWLYFLPLSLNPN